MSITVADRVWSIPLDQFVAAWNAAATLDEVAGALRALSGGPIPRWAVMARAGSLRKDGVPLKPLPSGACVVA